MRSNLVDEKYVHHIAYQPVNEMHDTLHKPISKTPPRLGLITGGIE